jgi:hypothetical protein
VESRIRAIRRASSDRSEIIPTPDGAKGGSRRSANSRRWLAYPVQSASNYPTGVMTIAGVSQLMNESLAQIIGGILGEQDRRPAQAVQARAAQKGRTQNGGWI